MWEDGDTVGNGDPSGDEDKDEDGDRDEDKDEDKGNPAVTKRNQLIAELLWAKYGKQP